jgi:hypothetical protein
MSDFNGPNTTWTDKGCVIAIGVNKEKIDGNSSSPLPPSPLSPLSSLPAPSFLLFSPTCPLLSSPLPTLPLPLLSCYFLIPLPPDPSLHFSLQFQDGSKLVAAIIGSIVGIVIIVLAIAFLVFWKYYKQKLNLSVLPPDVRWFYDLYYKNSSSWIKEGECSCPSPSFLLDSFSFLLLVLPASYLLPPRSPSPSPPSPSSESGNVEFYHKCLMKGSEAWDRMSFLFDDYANGREIMIQDAYAVYNPTLVGAFITQLYVEASL